MPQRKKENEEYIKLTKSQRTREQEIMQQKTTIFKGRSHIYRVLRDDCELNDSEIAKLVSVPKNSLNYAFTYPKAFFSFQVGETIAEFMVLMGKFAEFDEAFDWVCQEIFVGIPKNNVIYKRRGVALFIARKRFTREERFYKKNRRIFNHPKHKEVWKMIEEDPRMRDHDDNPMDMGS